METVARPEAPVDQLRCLYRYMASREFVANRAELTAAGFAPARIDNWLRTGRLIKVARSIYSYGRDIETPEAVRRAALLAAGPGSALIGRGACEVWGFVSPGSGLPALVEVGSNRGQARKFVGCSPAMRKTTIRVLRREWEPGDVRIRGGVRVACPTLALIEFAAAAHGPEIRFAFLEACRLGRFNEADVRYCFTRLTHRPGARTLRPYLGLWVPELRRIRSVFEGWFLLVWTERGYPMPEVNVRVFGYEVDFHWPEQRSLLELDGAAFHSDPARQALDREKQLHLEANGLDVRRLGYKAFEADPTGEVERIAMWLGYR